MEILLPRNLTGGIWGLHHRYWYHPQQNSLLLHPRENRRGQWGIMKDQVSELLPLSIWVDNRPLRALPRPPLFLGRLSSLLWHKSTQYQLNNLPCLLGFACGIPLTHELSGPWFQLSRRNRLHPVRLGSIFALPLQLIRGQVCVQPPPLGVYGPGQDAPLPIQHYLKRPLWMYQGRGAYRHEHSGEDGPHKIFYWRSCTRFLVLQCGGSGWHIDSHWRNGGQGSHHRSGVGLWRLCGVGAYLLTCPWGRLL